MPYKNKDNVVIYPDGSEFAEGLPIWEIPSVTYLKLNSRVVTPNYEADGYRIYEDS